jgi:N utilization substance protein A
MAITSANQLELLQTAEAVAREKMIDPDLVIEAMEDSLARAAKSRYGAEMDIRVKIDRKTGNATFTRVRTVVDRRRPVENQAEFTAQMTVRPIQARRLSGRRRPADRRRVDRTGAPGRTGPHRRAIGQAGHPATRPRSRA